MKRLYRGMLLACCTLLLSIPAQAIPVAGELVGQANFQGYRDVTEGGLTGNGSWADSFRIAWDITNNAGLFHYEYTLSELTKDLSFIIFQVSENFTQDNIFNPSPNFEDDGPREYSPDDPGGRITTCPTPSSV